MKKIISVLLLVSMLIAATACGSDSVESTNNDPVYDQQENVNEQTTEPLPADLRDDLPALDLEGSTVAISVEDYGNYTAQDIYIETENGDVVDDAVHTKNRNVEERLNVKLDFLAFTHYWDDRAKYQQYIQSSIFAGDGAFDLIYGLGYFIPGFVTDGILADMSELPYIDLSKRWWNSCFMDASSVDGKYYFITGDASLTLIKNMYCIYFNRDMLERLSIDKNLYELVDSEKWTLDEMSGIAKDCYYDLNGDGAKDREDRYGLLLNSGNHYTGFIEAFNVDIIAKNGDEITYVFGNEHNIEVVSKLCEFVKENDGVFYDPKGESETAYDSIFRNGEILMATGWLTHTDSYHTVDFKYGVLPYPKFTESQDSYHTTTLTSYGVFSVPVDTVHMEEAAMVLEAMGSESFRTVTPAYFETAMKIKYSESEDTARMFDIIRDNISFDFGYIYTIALNGISDKFKSAVGSGKNWATESASFEASAQKMLDDLLGAVRQNEG